jgi:hypothetical protein
MTPQEIDHIARAIRNIKNATDVDSWVMEIAVEAMRKQIPKEPKYKVEDRYIKNHFISIPICPICHREIVAGDMRCYSCGQRISWEEEHDER